MANEFHDKADAIQAHLVRATEDLGKIDQILALAPNLIVPPEYRQMTYDLTVLLIADLTNLERELRIESVRAEMNVGEHSSLFDGQFNQQPLMLDRLRQIDDAVVGATSPTNCAGTESWQKAECLVNLTRPAEETDPDPFEEVHAILSQRIYDEINAILSYEPLVQGATTLKPYELWDGIPFKYDRLNVAAYASSASKLLFETMPYGNGDVTGSVDGRVTGLFTGYDLTHTSGTDSTGSAIFISECLYLGGRLPMIAAISPAEECDADNPSFEAGWRVCCGDTKGATNSWKGHQGRSTFFTLLTNNQAEIIGEIGYDFAESLIRLAATEGSEIGGGTWKPNADKNEMYELFASGGSLSAVNTGDLVIVNLQGNGWHSFLIVGWGLAENCPVSINAPWQNVNFTTNRQNNGQEIPYIVDFGYGYRDDIGKTGWLQEPRVRPFYCSAANIDISDASPQINNNVRIKADDPNVFYSLAEYRERLRGGFGRYLRSDGLGADWNFYRMTNQINVPFSRLYKPPCEQSEG